MPSAPTKPTNSALIAAPKLRARFTASNADIQTRALQANVNARFGDTPHNCANVQTLGTQGIGLGAPDMQQLASKLDELISTLRRLSPILFPDSRRHSPFVTPSSYA